MSLVGKPSEDALVLVHPNGTHVTISLPADAATAARVMRALDKLGFDFERREP